MNPIIPLSIAALVFSAAPSLAEEGHDHHGATHEAHAEHMLEGYAVVAEALYKDDLATAKKAAAGMVKHDKDSAMAAPAKAISESNDLAEARTHFKELSDVAIPVAKEEKTMHVAHCPMAMGGKGADWLQKSADE
ncbi:MAG: DUF3347 domain-containing protein, partial [Verrucomicrobiae bacterium]|nr:DUF3347 domain-containing protein [Verrucomicrobiae bacterium]